MRAFAVYRAMLIEDKSLRKEIIALDEKISKVFRYMLDRIDALHQVEATPRKKIGYKDYENAESLPSFNSHHRYLIDASLVSSALKWGIKKFL